MFLEENEMPEHVRPAKVSRWDKIRIKSSDVTLSGEFEERKRKAASLIEYAWKMVKTCQTENGIGLAAPQIQIYKKFILCKTIDNENEKSFLPRYKLYINPKFSASVAEGKIQSVEHCLSVPDRGYEIFRWKKILLCWDEIDSEYNLYKKQETVDGFYSTLVQHEIDHLNGISIPQRWTIQNKK